MILIPFGMKEDHKVFYKKLYAIMGLVLKEGWKSFCNIQFIYSSKNTKHSEIYMHFYFLLRV
jgi:hypothetical protein